MSPKIPKEEAPATPSTSIETSTSLDQSDPMLIDYITLSKTDELLFQNSLNSLPFDDRFIIPQQLDLFAGMKMYSF